MPEHYVVMGDIVRSRDYEEKQLMRDFANLIEACNREFAAGILSPYTVTLGDEYQGVAASLLWSVRTIIYLDEARLHGEYSFKMRHVVHFGDVATPLNKVVAYGMLGSGLTKARELLTDKRRGRPRFCFSLPDQQLSSNLRQLLEVMSSITNAWKPRDVAIIFAMLANDNDTEVATELGKNRSQIWKRRKSLFIDEYKALRMVVLELAREKC